MLVQELAGSRSRSSVEVPPDWTLFQELALVLVQVQVQDLVLILVQVLLWVQVLCGSTIRMNTGPTTGPDTGPGPGPL